MNKDIVIVDYITRLSHTEVDPRLIEDIAIKLKNVRKYRGKIERRKSKIKRLYE